MTTSWRRWSWKLGLASWLVIEGAIASSGDHAFAQITPDTTLGNENSTVTSTDAVDAINGGATRGTNLFHSFQEFNVDEGRAAVFTNPAGIQNILTRVTGANPSNILGTLGVAGGNANLFLINPNGIIFGANARLDVGGSFVATTANAIGLSNGDFFSANLGQPLTTGSLNVNPNALLFNQIQAQAIINRFTVANTGLQVPEGKSLLLVGGDVRLEGGRLQAIGGRIELGGLASPGRVELSMNGSQGSLSFHNDVARANVYLTNNDRNPTRVNVAASDDGSIAITAQNIDIAGRSVLRGGIETDLGFSGAQAGNITLNATGAINVVNSGIINTVGSRAVGNAGNINITTGLLSLINGAQLQTATSGQGNAGSVNINARDLVSFDGVGSNEFISSAFSSIDPGAVGNGGNINITTGALSVTNGAQLNASTRGQGDAGSININASNTVSFDGTKSDGSIATAAFSSVDQKGRGKGGDIRITTGSLSLTSGAQLVVSADGQGDAGNVIINVREHVSFDGRSRNGRFGSNAFSDVGLTGRGQGGDIRITTGSFSLTNGAQLVAITRGQGDAGNVMINARDYVSFSGMGSDSRVFTGVGAVVEIGAVGKGGSINIITPSELSLSNGALLSATSAGEGKAGNVQLAAGSILLDQGRISAETFLGDGGNITISAQDVFLLRRGSRISTTAGTAQAGGNGGNINVDTNFLVATPSENSDVTANAYEGNGGNINIITQGIFGLEFREQRTPQSDITASSEFGVDGVVEINTPDVDPNRGLVALPTAPIDTEVAQACTPGGSQANSEFVVTGRGGLPPNPGESLKTDAVIVDLAALSSEVDRPSTPSVSSNFTSSASAPIVEAQGWIIAANGEVALTANVPTITPHSSWQTPANCHVLKTSS